MKKRLFAIVLVLGLIGSSAFADIGIGWEKNGSIQGPFVSLDILPFFTVEVGANLLLGSLDSPQVQYKYKTWTDPNPEPSTWTESNPTMPDKLSFTAGLGSAGARALLNLERPNQFSKFYLGVGANAIYAMLVGEITYDANSAISIPNVNADVTAIILEGVAFCGLEYRLPQAVNIAVGAEMSVALSYLYSVQANFSQKNGPDNYKVLIDLVPGVYWLRTDYGFYVKWYL